MAFLWWVNETEISTELQYEPSGVGAKPSHLTVNLPRRLVPALRAELEALQGGAFPEFRLDLPKQFNLFIKLRESGSSRLLVAHPESEEWVSTWMLTPALLKLWLEHLADDSFELIEPGARTDKFGNLNVTWRAFN